MVGRDKVKLLSLYMLNLSETGYMTEDEIDGFLDVLVEDYSQEELNDLSFIKKQMREVMGIKEDCIDPLLAGALHIKLIRKDQFALWQTLIKQKAVKH